MDGLRERGYICAEKSRIAIPLTTFIPKAKVVRGILGVMYDLYVFDLDGTLVDTMPDIYAAVQSVSGKLNLTVPTYEETEHAIGGGFDAFVKILFERNHSSRFDEIYSAFTRHYEEHLSEKSKPFPGAIELLDTLSKRAPCVVLTNKTSVFAKKLVPAIFGDSILEVFGAEDVPAIKPDPRGMKMVIEKYNSKNPLFVGDSIIDIETAKNASVPIAVFTEGYNHGKDLSGATFQVSALLEVAKL